jgi:hypothetical protein
VGERGEIEGKLHWVLLPANILKGCQDVCVNCFVAIAIFGPRNPTARKIHIDLIVLFSGSEKRDGRDKILH